MRIGTFPAGGVWIHSFPSPRAGGGGGGGVDVYDEGVLVLAAATGIDFTGAGVTASDQGGGIAEVSVPGGGGSDPLHPIIAALIFG